MLYLSDMTERIIIAGSGGQGIMLLGRILAQGVMKEDKYVTWLPSYGAEVRGGTSHCMVVISDKEISSPYIDKADTLIIMNRPSLEKFKNRIKNKGLLIINSSLVNPEMDRKVNAVRNTKPMEKKNKISNGVNALKYPFTDIAIKLGNIKVANTVALGCYLAQKSIVNPQTIFRVIEEIAPEDKRDLIEINKKALSLGRKLKNG